MLEVDLGLSNDLDQVTDEAQWIEGQGFDGIWVAETKHDPFLLSLQAGNATSTVTVGTAIAVALARTPMTLAAVAFDLQRYTGGRFVLGLGSQVKPHIERRFSMPWSHPAARMREFVLAVRAIWDTWQHGAPLEFRGEFYTHTIMTPFFSPAPLGCALPTIYLAGVGERMTEVAGEVGDGFFFHAFTTPQYLAERTLPALERGAVRADATLRERQVCGPALVTVGRDAGELDAAIRATKQQIAFYASTPGYRTVLELHGWGELQPQLTDLSRQGEWTAMTDLITDEMLERFSVVGSPAEVGHGLVDRFESLVDRVTLYTPYDVERDCLVQIANAIREPAGSRTPG